MKAVPSLATLLLVACGSAPAPVAPMPEPARADAPITMPADGDRYEVRIERDHVTVVSGGDLREVPDLRLAVDAAALMTAIDDLGLTPVLLVLSDDAAYGRAVAVMDALAARTKEYSLLPPPDAADDAAPTTAREGSLDPKDMPVITVSAAEMQLRDRRGTRTVTMAQLGVELAAADPFPGAIVLGANTNTPGRVINRILRTARRQGIGSVVFAVKTTNTP